MTHRPVGEANAERRRSMPYPSESTTDPGAMAFLTRGPIVPSLTSADVRMTTSPDRRTLPKTGGFSFASVPRPGAPPAVGGDRAALFSDRPGVALVARHDADLVAPDRAAEGVLGLAYDDLLPAVGSSSAGRRRGRGRAPLRVTGEDHPGRVLEAAIAGPALVALPLRLGPMPALFDDVPGIAVRAADAVVPAELAVRLVAPGVVGDPRDVDEQGGRPRVRRGRTGGPLGVDRGLRLELPHSSP
jgi:hypothetical protein